METKVAVVENQNVYEGLGKQKTLWYLFRKKFMRNYLAVLGAAVLIVLISIAILAPVLAPYNPEDIDLFRIQEGPSKEHALGTDELGRDVLTRILYGSRVTLLVGFTSMLISVVIGIFLGSIAGYYGKWIDNVIMRVTDVFLSFPSLILLIIVAAYFETTVVGMILIIGLTSWMSVARLVRGEFLSLKEKEFVEASVAIGSRDRRVIFKHILPNAMAPLIVSATLMVGYAIIFESALSFLGVGIKPPAATWGNMLSNAQQDIYMAPWLAIWPGTLIFITILAINFVGDGLRDALDPKVSN